jgi:hypothetical protein
MNVRRVRRRAALIALAAGAIAAVPPTSAAAATTPIVAGGSFARTVPFIDGYIYVFECHAVAPGALSTTISACYGPSTAPAVTSPGPAASTNGAVSANPYSTYQVCWTASAQYADGTTRSTSGCSTSSRLAGAGVSVG